MHKTHSLGPGYVTLTKEKPRFCWCRQNPGKKSQEKKKIYQDPEEEELPLPPPYWEHMRLPEQEKEVRKERDFPPPAPPVEVAPFPPTAPPSMMGVTVPALYPPPWFRGREKGRAKCSEPDEVYKEISREKFCRCLLGSPGGTAGGVCSVQFSHSVVSDSL